MRRLLLLGVFLWYAVDAWADKIPSSCVSMVAAIGTPEVKGDRTDRVILCRLGYVLSHDNDRKTPNWVVEHLTPDRFKGPGDRDEQGNPFAADPDLSKGKRAELVDYRGKLEDGRKFDRGHMAPAASMKFSEEAMTQSFYLSNMAPQQGIGLNRHIWADLEGIVRDWTCERGELFVITGPIYDDEPALLGPNEVGVPSAFFKLAYDPKESRAIAFILPNQKVDKKGKPAWEALKAYVVTLRTVEERAELDLLDKLDAREKKRLENLKSVMWPVRKPCSKNKDQ